MITHCFFLKSATLTLHVTHYAWSRIILVMNVTKEKEERVKHKMKYVLPLSHININITLEDLLIVTP